MAMVAGRYPIFPESPLTTLESLELWSKHPQASPWDAPTGASVTLRKVVAGLQRGLLTKESLTFSEERNAIDKSLAEWRKKAGTVIGGPGEYDIIVRFSNFVLVSTIVQRQQHVGRVEPGAPTFDTSMVAYCALFIVHAIESSASELLTDWSLPRLAILLELIAELERQAAVRHHTESASMTVVDAMAQQLSRSIRVLLKKKSTRPQSATVSLVSPRYTGSSEMPYYDDPGDFTFGNTNMPFGLDWDVENTSTGAAVAFDFNSRQTPGSVPFDWNWAFSSE
ncbi:MAG: hypothetical protein CYPHOPRED_004341 [Cyphobasidiales sp. Tagirdzhanova-0007]|nr:MAG: hypothetical protein CYPHOPRED_004341 [Cyphobasidiales sp. Tagirdzhanova-0007]